MAHDIIILHDGTPQADVLEAECKKNPNVKAKVVTVKADPENLEKYFDKLSDSDKKTVIYVPFTSEQFNQYNMDTQRNQIRTKYPELNVFYAYEFMSQEGIVERGNALGVKKVAEIEAAINEEAVIEDAKPETNKPK